MTNRDVIITILGEVSGQPADYVDYIIENLIRTLGLPEELDDELPDKKAHTLLANLRDNLPDIRLWLAKCTSKFSS